jgi:ribosomal protein S18 acetylase RimI-like enzyme
MITYERIDSTIFDDVIKRCVGDLLRIEEKCFHPNLQETWDDKVDLLENSISYFLAFDGEWQTGRVIGEIFAIALKDVPVEEDDLSKEKEGEYWKTLKVSYLREPVAYIYSIGVLPDYQGQGIAKRLMVNLLRDLKDDGADYTHVISHCRNGASMTIHGMFGFDVLHRVTNWYDVREDYTCVELKLQTFQIANVIPIAQRYAYDCGAAAVMMLFKLANMRIDFYNYDKICRELAPVLAFGSRHENILRVLRIYQNNIVRLVESFDELNLALYRHHPVIIHVLHPGDHQGHYVVVFGYRLSKLERETLYFIIDPDGGNIACMTGTAIKRLWYNEITCDKWGVYLT